MADYLDPTYDLGFKLIFGREQVSNELLTELLNAIFGYCGNVPVIKSVVYKNNERQSEWKEGKGIRYDILCETETGHNFIVEMQKASQENFLSRAEYYVSRGIAEQGYKGKDEDDTIWDYSLKPVIGVFICNFPVKDLDKRVIVRSSIMDEDTHKRIGGLSRYIYIQLPFFTKREDECESLIDQWIYNIKNMGTRQEVAFMKHNAIFQRLAQVSNVATLTPEERYSYDADVKNARDALNQIRFAYNEGRAEEKIANAKAMMSFGVDIDIIQKVTGLSANEIMQY